MTIYKVRFLDVLGKEVAEFGFYESKDDAERRRREVAPMITSPGTLEVRPISIIPSAKQVAEDFNIDYYVLKEE